MSDDGRTLEQRAEAELGREIRLCKKLLPENTEEIRKAEAALKKGDLLGMTGAWLDLKSFRNKEKV